MAQDEALSRLKPGFEFPWGHTQQSRFSGFVLLNRAPRRRDVIRIPVGAQKQSRRDDGSVCLSCDSCKGDISNIVIGN